MRVEQYIPEPAGPPVGRVMQFQYIDAGQALHRVLMTLPWYKRLDAVAGAGGGVSDELLALIGAPLLAGVMAVNEPARMMLWPIFAEQIKASAVSIARASEEQHDAVITVAEYQADVDEMMSTMQDALFSPRETDETEPADA
jgi:hypothetical protein